MSDRLTASGLQSSAGLFGQCGVYEFDLNGSIFNPQDLNPYLLFDAETSMIGTLENPTLDLDPSKQETLDVITATRAGSATFVNISGQIETAQANTVRVDHSLGYPAILVEPSATNHLINTDFSTWGTQNITVSSGGGFKGYSSSVITATGTSNKFFTATLSGITAGQTHTGSIYIRRTNGSGRVDFVHPNSTSGSDSSNRTITPDWTRVTCQFNGSTSSGVVTQFQIRMFTGGDSLEIAMPQVEEGAVATSFIPTSGSTVTRAADDLVISGSAFSSFFSSSEGTFYAEYQFNDADGANSLIYGSADNQRFAYKNAGSTSPLLSYDGVNVLSYGRLAAGTLLRTALSFDSTSMEGSQDGSAATMSGQTAPFPHNGNFLSATELSIGSDTSGGKQLNGQIKRLLFWPVSSDRL